MVIPAPLRAEHEELYAGLVKATKGPGAVGEAAREVARLLHPHFAREEAFALPPLALLVEITRSGGVRPEMAEVLPMTRPLEAELPAVLAERFAETLLLHAQTEELVLYRAAILIGVAQRLRM